MFKLLNLFQLPSPEALRQRQLETARRELVEAEYQAEGWHHEVTKLTARVERLERAQAPLTRTVP